MKKVSIIVPVYNTSKYLKDCIESIVNQTYDNIEIIIINDGSTDNSLSICGKYKESDERVILKSIPNSGVSTARNVGLDLVTGDYVTFVDSDDWIEEDTIELGIQKITENNADIAIWSYYKNYDSKELSLSLVPGKSRNFHNDKEKEILYLKSVYANYNKLSNGEDVSVGTVMCKMYKSDFLRENQLRFNPKLIRSEDVIFAINAFKLAKKITYFDKSLYHYRINADSFCNSYRFIDDTISPFNLLIDELNAFKEKVDNNSIVEEVINCRIIQIMLWHLKYNYFNKDNKLSLLKKRREIIKLIKSDYYNTALNNVSFKHLPKQEKAMVKLFRRRLILVYYIIQKLLTIRNNFKSN